MVVLVARRRNTRAQSSSKLFHGLDDDSLVIFRFHTPLHWDVKCEWHLVQIYYMAVAYVVFNGVSCESLEPFKLVLDCWQIFAHACVGPRCQRIAADKSGAPTKSTAPIFLTWRLRFETQLHCRRCPALGMLLHHPCVQTSLKDWPSWHLATVSFCCRSSWLAG